jgi:hypothetical protein
MSYTEHNFAERKVNTELFISSGVATVADDDASTFDEAVGKLMEVANEMSYYTGTR